MKYIRTKDMIVTSKEYDDFFGAFIIINQADTIEELCDRCVVIHKYRGRPQDMSFYEAQYFIDVWTRKVKSNDPIVAIYGAIWTEWGLKYVAKMNDKGELELL